MQSTVSPNTTDAHTTNDREATGGMPRVAMAARRFRERREDAREPLRFLRTFGLEITRGAVNGVPAGRSCRRGEREALPWPASKGGAIEGSEDRHESTTGVVAVGPRGNASGSARRLPNQPFFPFKEGGKE